jgi:hypothetical protein
MKKLLLALTLVFLLQTAFAQTNPTLSVGLESLVAGKGSIDVVVLTKAIMEKRKELQQEALKRFMLSLFPQTNYTTKFYIQNCLNTLLNEKNPKVIERQILEYTTNYALALGVTKVYHQIIKNNGTGTDAIFRDINTTYKNYRNHSDDYKAALLADYKKEKIEKEDVNALQDTLDTHVNVLIDTMLKRIGEPNKESIYKNDLAYHYLDSLERRRRQLEKRITRIKMRHNATFEVVDRSADRDKLPFGMLLDVVSSTLSEMEPLKSRGFFRDPINYKNGDFYISLGRVRAYNNDVNIKFRTKLDDLGKKISEEIKPYIVNYQLIKELFSAKLETKIEGDINTTLIMNYVNVITSSGQDIDSFVKIVGNALDTAATLPGQKLLANNAKEKMKVLLHDKDIITIYISQLQTLKKLYTVDSVFKVNKCRLQKLYEPLIIGNDQIAKDLDNLKIDSVSFLTNHFQEIKNLKISSDSLNKFKAAGDIDKLKQAITCQLEMVSDANLRKAIALDNNSGQEVDVITKVIPPLLDIVRDSTTSNLKIIMKTGNFFEPYLKQMISSLIANANRTPYNNADKEAVTAYAEVLAKAYKQLNLLAKKSEIELKDINYVDDELLPELVKYSIIFHDTSKLTVQINKFRIFSQLLKIKAVSGVSTLKKYQDDLVKLFDFIANLGNLDKIQTYEAMTNLFQDANNLVKENLEDEKFKQVYTLFSNGIRKYIIPNQKDHYIEVDILSFLTDLQQYFDRNNDARLALYLTLGLNQSIFFSQKMLPNSTEQIKYLGYASEKIGIKVRLGSFNRVRDYENTIKNDLNLNRRQPFVNQAYWIVYGSGLLYSIANTTTSKVNFDYPHVGTGIGLRFYNALDVNLYTGFPFIKNQSIWNNAFWGIGLDIPLGEYLEKLNSK